MVMPSHLPLFPGTSSFSSAPSLQSFPSSFLNFWDTSTSYPEGDDPLSIDEMALGCPSPVESHLSSSFDLDTDDSSAPPSPQQETSDNPSLLLSPEFSFRTGNDSLNTISDPIRVLPVFFYGEPSSTSSSSRRQTQFRNHPMPVNSYPAESSTNAGSSSSARSGYSYPNSQPPPPHIPAQAQCYQNSHSAYPSYPPTSSSAYPRPSSHHVTQPSFDSHSHSAHRHRRQSTVDSLRTDPLCDIDDIALRDPDDRSDVANFISRTSPLFGNTHNLPERSSPQPYSYPDEKPDIPVRADTDSILRYAFHCRPPGHLLTPPDLRSGMIDIQGINWSALKTTPQTARASRYADYFRHEAPLVRTVPQLASSLRYYRFDSMHSHAKVTIPHFQLRNLVAITSHSDLYYGSGSTIVHCNLVNFECRTVLNLTGASANPRTHHRITCISARHGILMAVGLHGEYTIVRLGSSLDGSRPELAGVASNHAQDSGINHVEVFLNTASAYPLAAMSLNGGKLSILDCLRNQMINQFALPSSVNCSAGSPDGRLRCVVGDWANPLIFDCQASINPIQQLESHGGTDSFACAWSDNGLYVTTGGEDGTVKVYDVRRWSQPIKEFSTHMGPARSLTFSSWKNGEPVLAVAEADDYVSIVDAQRWNHQQVLDGFGAVGGIAFDTLGENDLFVANGDPNFGGLTRWVMATQREQAYEPGVPLNRASTSSRGQRPLNIVQSLMI